MNIFTNKQITRKINIVLLIVILFNFLVPIQSQADLADFGGDLLKELIKLFVSLGDVVNGVMNHLCYGTTKMYGSAIFKVSDAELKENLTADGSSLKYKEGQGGTYITLDENTVFEAAGGWFGDEIQIPNILYCPENIFANKIAMLDINFIKPNSYIPVEETSSGTVSPGAANASQSLVIRDDVGTKSLKYIISSWYQAFRNIAIVGLLIVLVYIGIRIMISSTSTDKAKYKENLQDWFIALCLVFFMHYLMSGILLVTESFTKLIDDSISSDVWVDASKVKENDVMINDTYTATDIGIEGGFNIF